MATRPQWSLTIALMCAAASALSCSAPDQKSAPAPQHSTPDAAPNSPTGTPSATQPAPDQLPYNPGGMSLTQVGNAEFVGSIPARFLDPDKKVMYLTFDDGPDPTYTPQVLKILAAADAKATFFVLGQAAKRHPEIIADIRAAGHAIGSHTWDHKNLRTISAAALTDQMTKTDAVLGARTTCMRPPYGATNTAVRNQLIGMNKWILHWDLGSGDWQRRSAQQIQDTLVSGAKNGALTLMHDGAGNRAKTVTAVAATIAELAPQGWRFEVLPMCQLVALDATT